MAVKFKVIRNMMFYENNAFLNQRLYMNDLLLDNTNHKLLDVLHNNSKTYMPPKAAKKPEPSKSPDPKKPQKKQDPKPKSPQKQPEPPKVEQPPPPPPPPPAPEPEQQEQISEGMDEATRRKKQADMFKRYLEQTGIAMAFQVVFAEILDKKIDQSKVFQYSAMRIRQIGEDLQKIKLSKK